MAYSHGRCLTVVFMSVHQTELLLSVTAAFKGTERNVELRNNESVCLEMQHYRRSHYSAVVNATSGCCHFPALSFQEVSVSLCCVHGESPTFIFHDVSPM